MSKKIVFRSVNSTGKQKIPRSGKLLGRPLETKREQLIRMLCAPKGARLDAISVKLGWQAHTTRAALSRLRKAGFLIQREIPAGGKPVRYRVIARSKSDGRPHDA